MTHDHAPAPAHHSHQPAPHVKHQLPGTIELLKHAWAMYKSRAKSIIASMLMPLVLMAAFGIAILIVFFATGFVHISDVPGAQGSGWTDFFLGLCVIVFSVLYAFLGIAAFLVVDPFKHRGYWQSVKESPRLFWGFLCISFLLLVVIYSGMILLVIPGILFAIWYGFSLYVRLYESEKGVLALQKSHHYVRGYFWPVLGRFVVIGLLLYVPYFILIAISGVVGVAILQGILMVLAWAFTVFVIQPIFLCFSVLLYATLKQVKATQPFIPSRKGRAWIIAAAVLLPLLLIGSTFAVVVLGGTREKARDALRISHVQSIQLSLELYRAEQGFYPIEPTSIVLGEDMNDILTNQGFEDDAQLAGTIIYMNHVPREPYLRKDWLDASETNDYTYASADGQTYQITFQLEGSIGANTPSKEDDLSGWVMATPDGMAKADY